MAAITSPTFSTISRGSSDLPVICAGHTEVQRPQIVQESVSSSCFQVKSSMVAAPKVSKSLSMRLGIGRMAPFGRSLCLSHMFTGEVKMWRSIVIGRISKNSTKVSTWAIHQNWCQPAMLPKSSAQRAIQ